MSKITIEMDTEFLEWWKTLAPHVQENQTTMIIAWWSWKKGQEVLKSKGGN